LNILWVNPNNILVSFDIISLFTKMPITYVLNLLSQLFDEDSIRHFYHILTSFFCFNSQFYKQTERTAMGSPMSPTNANYFMEDF
jgi:hypothetical protein